MVSFKDLLSAKAAETLVSFVDCGDIVRMKLTKTEGVTPKNDGDTDRNKYFVVLGKTEDGKVIGFVLINSHINNNLSEEVKLLHYPIKKSKYPFLDHDSFIFCGQLKEINLAAFADRYKSQTFGKLADDDLELVIQAVVSSPSESKKHLRKFGLIP